EKLAAIVRDGWKVPLALFIVMHDLLAEHPEIWLEVDDRPGRGSEVPILDIFAAKKSKRAIEAMYAALGDRSDIFVSGDTDPDIENIYFEFDIEHQSRR